MARARNIKPGFFTNEKLGELSPLARILFEGLWCLADRRGRLEDRPKKIKVEILPYDDCDCDELLNALQNSGFIMRYSAGEGQYIQVNNFEKHQNPHKNESESTIPAPEEYGASTIPAPEEYGASTVQAPEEHSTNRADSLILIPDSLSLDSPIMRTAQSEFADFWSAYPKKKSKGDAEKAWNALKPSKELVATMLEKLAQAKTCRDWTKDSGQFIPYPASWLRAKGWEDEYAPGSVYAYGGGDKDGDSF